VNAATGRGGGIRLGRDPAAINIGEVVRRTEPNFRIVECFDAAANTCRILPVCTLRGVLMDALEAFFHALDKYTLADLVRMKGSQRISDFLPVEVISAKLTM
jgi:Rrf2 family nitric oxide-sensitive transcriptional repressor